MNTNASRRVLYAALRLAAVSLAAASLAPSAPAQVPGADARAPWVRIYQRRSERTVQSVDKLSREQMRKDRDSAAGSGPLRTLARPGVLRVSPPEERQALEHAGKGLDYFARNKFEKAIQEFKEAIRIFPAASVVHNNLGSAYFALGRLDEAVASFQEAVRLDPGFAQAYFNLGLLYLKQGHEPEAARALDEAAKGFVVSGDENLRAGYLEDAEDDFKSLLLIDPEFYPGRLKLGMVYHAGRRHKEAAEIFERLTRQHPHRWEAYRHLGETLYALGQYTQASEQLRKAVALKPDAPDARYHLGKAYIKLRQLDLALAECRQLRELKAPEQAATLEQLLADAQPRPKR